MDKLGLHNNGVLNNLNPQRFTSQIPTSTNGFKKSRLTNNSGLTDMINESIAKHAKLNPNGEIRKSLRSSKRTSLLPSIGTQMLVTNRDPRPLRDKNFQIALQQEIFDYLKFEKFDIGTDHQISLKALKQPTQKDFIHIFKWLYLKLDPGYTFNKSLEHEVYSILKTIQYPYLETINRSQISAVGGSNWPKFLGMLHWLVMVNKKLDKCLLKLDASILNQNTLELTVLKQPLHTLDEQDDKQEKYELMVERLFIDYIMSSYKSFLRLDDNYDQYLTELQYNFQQFVHIIETDIENISSQNEKLSTECETIVAHEHELKIARDKFNALRNDLTKFQIYVDAMELKSHDWPTKLEQMETEAKKKKEQIHEVEIEITTLYNSLKSKNISLDEIDSINQEHEKMTKSLESVSTSIDSLTGVIKLQKSEAGSIYKNFLDTVKQYRLALEGLILARNGVSHNIDGSRLAFDISSDLLSDENLGLEPRQILPPQVDIINTIKPALLELDNEIQLRIRSLEKENTSLETRLEELKDEIKNKGQLLEALESEFSETKSEYEEYKQQSHSQLLSQRIEIEKFERKIQNARNSTQQKISQAEQEAEAVRLRYEELKLSLNRERLSLHNKVIHIIEYVSNFKISVQNSIEDVFDLTRLSNVG